MQEEFEILITSPPDREKIVAEVWLRGELIAEVNQELGYLEVQLYTNDKKIILSEIFQKFLNEAKKKLVNIQNR
jgi:hypothetical protein